MPEHRQRAGAGVEQAGEHLEGRCLAGAVGTEEPDDLAGSQLERDPIDRPHFFGAAVHQARYGRRSWPITGRLPILAATMACSLFSGGPEPTTSPSSAITRQSWG